MAHAEFDAIKIVALLSIYLNSLGRYYEKLLGDNANERKRYVYPRGD